MLSHPGSADVIGDVPAEILRGETEDTVGGGNRILSVVAEKEHAARQIPVDAPERRRRHLLPPQPIKPLLHRLTSYSLDTNPGGLISASLVLPSGKAVSGQGCDAIREECRFAFASVK